MRCEAACGLHLLGAVQEAAEGSDLAAFLRPLFERLEGEVRRRGLGLARCIGYESVGRDDSGVARFFGIVLPAEIDADAESLARDGLVVREPDRDFADGFRIFAATWVGPHSPDDDVLIAEYDPEWPARFERLRAEVSALFGADIVRRIEHYGSTAVRGLAAKPVIDILVEVPSVDDAFAVALDAFDRPECECWRFEDDALVIVRERPLGRRVAHIHLATAEHRIWRGIEFRDWLRAHPEDVRRYEALKRELAERYGSDREAYTEAKGEFVRGALGRAKGPCNGR
ncbi:MAG: GrpB family protein [Coriobacteriia bacterium]